MNIHHLDIVLENCEVFSIPVEEIAQFNIGNKDATITTRTDDGYKSYPVADNIILLLKKDRPVKESPYSTVFERLMTFNDITHIDVFYSEDIHEYFAVVWCDDLNPEENRYQTSEMVGGMLKISIIGG